MKIKVIDIKGKDKQEIDLNDEVFNIEKPSLSIIHEAIKNELANKRQGTSSTKTKAEVRGTGAKPWRQKGTGRARVGTRRNPVWTGGGIAFGPKPRDFSFNMNKKAKRLAYKSIFSIKNSENNLIVIETFKLENNKTKEMFNIFSNLFNNEKIVLIVNDNEEAKLLKRAGKNIPWLKTLSYNRLNAHTLYYSKKVVIIEDAAEALNKFFEKKQNTVVA